MLKAVHLIYKFGIFALWRSQFETNTGNSMLVKGSCSVSINIKNIKNNGIKLWMPCCSAYR